MPSWRPSPGWSRSRSRRGTEKHDDAAAPAGAPRRGQGLPRLRPNPPLRRLRRPSAEPCRPYPHGVPGARQEKRRDSREAGRPLGGRPLSGVPPGRPPGSAQGVRGGVLASGKGRPLRGRAGALRGVYNGQSNWIPEKAVPGQARYRFRRQSQAAEKEERGSTPEASRRFSGKKSSIRLHFRRQ